MSDLILSAQELLASAAGLRAIGQRELPARTAYAIVKAKRRAEEALQDLESVRVQLCVKHADKNADGTPVIVDGKYAFADVNAFNAEWAVALTEPVALPGVRSIALSELDGVSVTPDELLALGPFVSEPTDEPPMQLMKNA